MALQADTNIRILDFYMELSHTLFISSVPNYAWPLPYYARPALPAKPFLLWCQASTAGKTLLLWSLLCL